MSEVTITLTDKEDGTLGIRLLTDAPEDSGASILAKMFLEFVSQLQAQEQKKEIAKIITNS
jgi:hypothetical protein